MSVTQYNYINIDKNHLILYKLQSKAVTRDSLGKQTSEYATEVRYKVCENNHVKKES